MGYFFLTTLSRDIRLFTCGDVPYCMAKQLSRLVRKIVQLYARGGFIIRVILMDMESEKIKDEMGLVGGNTMVAKEHMAKIEMGICLIKERCRCVVKSLPFRYLHKQIVIFVVYFVMMFVMPYRRKKVSPRSSPHVRWRHNEG